MDLWSPGSFRISESHSLDSLNVSVSLKLCLHPVPLSPPPPPPPPPPSLGLSHFTEHVVFIRRVGLEHKGRSAMVAILTPLLLCLPSIISYAIGFAHSARASSHSALWCQLQIYPQNLNIQTWPEIQTTLKISFFKNCWLKGFFGEPKMALLWHLLWFSFLQNLFLLDKM